MGPGTASQWLLCATLMVALCQGQEDWMDMQCPLECKCKWVSGKKTAECIKQNLTEVPSFSHEIQILDMTGNRIIHLMHDEFMRAKLENLHKVVLRDCGLETIHTAAFNGLKIIIEIDLSSNSIHTLQPGTFSETVKLRVLLLNQNQLRSLENNLFFNLTHLQKVLLSDNKLEYIGERTFQDLPALQSLSLDGNNFRTLQLQSFESLPKISSLELRNNPWNCNCELKSFRDWTIRRKLYTKPTTCHEPPSMAGKMWNEVLSNEFACRPKILYVGPATKIEMGKGDVTLSCKASGIPQPEVNCSFCIRVYIRASGNCARERQRTNRRS